MKEDTDESGKNLSYSLEIKFTQIRKLKHSADSEILNKNYTTAISLYNESIEKTVEILNDNEIKDDLINKIQGEIILPSYMNICFGYLQTKNWIRAGKYANKVLEFDKNNVKAKYRRCYAYIKSGKFKKADRDLEELEDLIGGSEELEILEKEFEENKLRSEGNDGEFLRKIGKKLKRGIGVYKDKKENDGKTRQNNNTNKGGFCSEIYRKIRRLF